MHYSESPLLWVNLRPILVDEFESLSPPLDNRNWEWENSKFTAESEEGGSTLYFFSGNANALAQLSGQFITVHNYQNLLVSMKSIVSFSFFPLSYHFIILTKKITKLCIN
jgi:hypothetical protein